MARQYKVGITINFDISFFSNGLQQNVVFLQKLINEIDNFQAFFLWEGKKINDVFVDKDECIKYKDFLKDDFIKLDLVIMMGFTIRDNYILKYKEKNKTSKFVLFQCGNQFVENVSFSLFDINKLNPNSKHSPIKRLRQLDQIWLSPHYKKNIPYTQQYFKNENVIEAPYIWDSLFIDYQVKKYNLKKISNLYNSKNNILILEPNLNQSKHCILPLFLVESYEQKFPNILKSCNIFCGEKIFQNDYFIKLILDMDIYKYRKNFLKVHKRIPFLSAIKNFGSIIISYQQDNALNYLYLEALYLGLPLLHNSEFIQDFGYFYPENDINIGRDKLDLIVRGHQSNLDSYKNNSNILLNKFSYKNENNKENYYKIFMNLIKN